MRNPKYKVGDVVLYRELLDGHLVRAIVKQRDEDSQWTGDPRQPWSYVIEFPVTHRVREGVIRPQF